MARDPRGTRQQRGYGEAHSRLRSQLLPLAIGTPCPRCGEVMRQEQTLHLDHTDDRTGYLGITHARCNIQAADRSRERQARPTEAHPGEL